MKKIRIKVSNIDELLTEGTISFVSGLHDIFKAGGKLADLGSLINKAKSGFDDAINLMKLAPGQKLSLGQLGARGGGPAFVRSLLDATPGLRKQIDEVVAATMKQLEQGKAVDLGGGVLEEGAVRIKFRGNIKYINDAGKEAEQPVTLYLTVGKDGVIPGSMGLGSRYGKNASFNAWKKAGGKTRKTGGAAEAGRAGARGADDVADVIDDVARLGSKENPYPDFATARLAVKGKNFKWKDIFRYAKRLSKKYKDKVIPARPASRNVEDPYIWISSGDDLDALVYKNGELTTMSALGLKGDKALDPSKLQAQWSKFVEDEALFGWGEHEAFRAIKSVNRGLEHYRAVYWLKDETPSVWYRLNSVMDILGATPLRFLSDPLILLLKEAGIMQKATAIEWAQKARWTRVTLIYVGGALWIIDNLVDAANWIMGETKQAELATLRNNYRRDPSPENKKALDELEAKFVRLGKIIAAETEGVDPADIKTADDAFKHAVDFKNDVSKARAVLQQVMRVLPEDTLGGKIWDGLWAFGDPTESGGEILDAAVGKIAEQVKKAEDLGRKVADEVKEKVTGKAKEAERQVRATIGGRDVEEFEVDIPVKKARRRKRRRWGSIGGAGGLEEALEEALNTSNVIVNKADPSSPKLKIKLKEKKS